MRQHFRGSHSETVHLSAQQHKGSGGMGGAVHHSAWQRCNNGVRITEVHRGKTFSPTCLPLAAASLEKAACSLDQAASPSQPRPGFFCFLSFFFFLPLAPGNSRPGPTLLYSGHRVALVVNSIVRGRQHGTVRDKKCLH